MIISVVFLLFMSTNWVLFTLFGQIGLAKEFTQGNNQWLLKYLILIVIHMFQFENIVNFVYFSYIGGPKLIIHLSNVAILNSDIDNKLGLKIVRKTFSFLFAVQILNTVCKMFWENESVLMLISKMMASILFHSLFMSSQYQVTIFYYCMEIYKKQIQSIKSKYSKSSKCLLFA